MSAEESAGLTWADTAIALVCSSFAGLMFCWNQFPIAELKQALFLSIFVIPAVWLITLIVELPVLHFVRKRGYTHPLIFTLLPGLALLVVNALLLVNSSLSSLRNYGLDFIVDGEIVWENFGWFVLFQSEPAFWASLAGLLFWLLRVRRN